MRPAPYCRIVVFMAPSAFANGASDPPRRKRVPRPSPGYAYEAHNVDRGMERATGRLTGSGSFYWESPRAAWRRARVIARDPGVQQIKVETISGRAVGRMFADGTAYAYDGREDR